MDYSFDGGKIAYSRSMQEDYFPVIIEFSNEEINNLFIEFNYEDSDMFEITVDPETFSLKRFSLTLCNHYAIKDTELKIPEYEEGSLFIAGPASTECDKFEADVYNDGVEIRTSSSIATRYLKSGQLIFALTENNDVSAVLITDLTQGDIDHAISELTVQTEQDR